MKRKNNKNNEEYLESIKKEKYVDKYLNDEEYLEFIELKRK